MRPSAEARLGIASLLALQLLTSSTGVLLLGRMAPAVERILTENVYSTEAVEEMFSALVDGKGEARFQAALDRARSNITEPEEVELVHALERIGPAALAGDGAAREEATSALRRLGAVNRASMEEADRAAQQLGLAGAWAMALLGFIGFLGSLAVFRRVDVRLLGPIVEIDAVLSAARAGDTFRRCAGQIGSLAGGRAMASLNWLLDKQRTMDRPPGEDAALRDIVVALVDRCTDRPVVVSDRAGVVVAVNVVAIDTLDQQDAPAGIASSVAAGVVPEGWAVTDLAGAAWWVERPPGSGAGS